MTPGNKDAKFDNKLPGDITAVINSKVQEVRAYFERRVGEVMEENGNIISELRQKLSHTQRQVNEKDDVICRLLEGSRRRYTHG